LRLWIKARARLPLLLYEFAKTGQDKFAVLFNLFVGDVAERIEKYSSGPFVGLGGFSGSVLLTTRSVRGAPALGLIGWLFPGEPRHRR
jgi:hypothetical protein